MFEKILIATDLSESSYSLLQCLSEIGNIGVKTVILTHVMDTKYSVSVSRRIQDDSENMLDKQTDIFAEKDMVIKTDLRMGVPWTEILKSARQNKAACIVVGSHGKSLARDIILGSVTSELAEQSDLPVLILRQNKLDRKRNIRLCKANISRLFDNVACATDFSDENKGALYFLKEMAEYIKKVTFVHVQEPILLEQPIEFDMQELDAIDNKRLEDIGKTFCGKAEVTGEVLHGMASVELTDFINSGKYTLMIMGSRGLGATARFILGSASRYVIRHSDIPVMMIPGKQGKKK